MLSHILFEILLWSIRIIKELVEIIQVLDEFTCQDSIVRKRYVIINCRNNVKKPFQSANLRVFYKRLILKGLIPYLLFNYLYFNISGLIPSSREGEEFFS